jgi:hypothetical protein
MPRTPADAPTPAGAALPGAEALAAAPAVAGSPAPGHALPRAYAAVGRAPAGPAYLTRRLVTAPGPQRAPGDPDAPDGPAEPTDPYGVLPCL